MSDKHRILIVSPVRNEGEYLRTTIEAIVSQTIPPALWIIVDDGSTDETARIAAAASEKHPWIQVIKRDDRGRRVLGAGVVEAFYAGYDTIDPEDFDFVCKVDGDISVGPMYFEHLLKYFDDNPRLGAASGKVWCVEDGNWFQEKIRDETVSGAFKCYRRKCFSDIGGFVRGMMWDAIDFHKARLNGWDTCSLRDDELRIRHYRLMGSSDRHVLVGRMRWGYGHYFMGSHPLYVFAVSVYRWFERPFFIGGVCIMLGYVSSWLRRKPRYNDHAFRKQLRKWQMWKIHLGPKPPQY